MKVDYLSRFEKHIMQRLQHQIDCGIMRCGGSLEAVLVVLQKRAKRCALCYLLEIFINLSGRCRLDFHINEASLPMGFFITNFQEP
jgi:hypothetical protein